MKPPYRVCLLDTKTRNPNHYICRAVKLALEKLPEVELVVLASNGNAVESAIRHRCNIFFAVDGEDMHLDICARVAQVCDLSVLWLTEDPYELDINVRNAELFDLVFTNESSCVSKYGRKAQHLPFAASERFHSYSVKEDSQLRYDVFFAGTAWPNRTRLLGSLVRDLSEKKLKIALSHNPFIPEPELPMPKSSFQWRTPVTDFARFANVSRVTLTLPRIFTASSGGIETGSTPPPRLFEAASAGTAQLVDSSIQELRNYFEPGKEVATFANYRECLSQVRDLIGRPDRRRALAEAARTRARREHTYEERVKVVVQRIADAPIRGSSVAQVRKRKKRLLFVVHNATFTLPFGGVEVYLEGLVRHLRDDYEVFFFAPKGHDQTSQFVIKDSDYRTIETFSFEGHIDAHVLTDPVREHTFADILGRYRIDLVHFHHLLNHLPSYIHIAKTLGVPVVATLQDYWVMCDSFNLIDYRQRYCDVVHQPDATCEICMLRRRGIGGGLGFRREFFRRALSCCDRIIVNTAGYTDILSRFYPDVVASGRTRVLPLPLRNASAMLTPGNLALETNHQERKGHALKIALLGNFTVQKGADALLLAMDLLRDEPFEFTLLGQISAPYDLILKEAALPKLKIHGPYKPEDLPALLRGLDVSLHVSVWPETYCIALSEAWMNGLIPIVADTGALGERVQTGINGYKVPPDSPGAIADALRRIERNREMIPRIRQGVGPDLVCSEKQHVEALRKIYNEIEMGYPNFAVPSTSVHSRVDLFVAGIAVRPTFHSRGDGRHVSSARLVNLVSLATPNELDVAAPSDASAPIPRLAEAVRLSAGKCPGFLDSLNGQTLSGKTTFVAIEAGKTVTLLGWTFDLETKKAFPEVFLILRPTTRDEVWLVPAKRHSRADVNNAYGKVAGDCGVEAKFSTSGLRREAYRVTIAQRTPGGYLETSEHPFQPILLQVFTAPKRTLPGDYDSVPQITGEAVKIKFICEGTVQESGEAVVEICSIMPAALEVQTSIPKSALRNSAISKPFLRLMSLRDGSVYYSASEAPFLEDQINRRTNFIFEVPFERLSAGVYDVDLLLLQAGSVIVHPGSQRIRLIQDAFVSIGGRTT